MNCLYNKYTQAAKESQPLKHPLTAQILPFRIVLLNYAA